MIVLLSQPECEKSKVILSVKISIEPVKTKAIPYRGLDRTRSQIEEVFTREIIKKKDL